MRTPSKLVMFTAGTLSGLGIAVATLSGAADSIIPYQFKDGQVISADTLNDLFGQIKNSTQGFSSESELNGAWTCVTYDSTGAASKTAGMPNSNFSTDSTTGLQAISQNWTFSSNGTNLTMNLVKLGGIQSNNTNICGGGTASYNSKIVESSLMLTGVTAGCNNGDGYVLPLNRVSL